MTMVGVQSYRLAEVISYRGKFIRGRTVPPYNPLLPQYDPTLIFTSGLEWFRLIRTQDCGDTYFKRVKRFYEHVTQGANLIISTTNMQKSQNSTIFNSSINYTCV